jgi:hypothetical protein
MRPVTGTRWPGPQFPVIGKRLGVILRSAANTFWRPSGLLDRSEHQLSEIRGSLRVDSAPEAR